MELDQEVLGEVLAWGQALPGFKPAHARNALTVIQGYTVGATDRQGRFLRGIAPDRRRELTLFAIDMTWLFWLDEQFDAGDRTGWLEPETLIRNVIADEPGTEASPFDPLRAAFASYRTHLDYRLWTRTLADIISAWRKEALLSEGSLHLSYYEYLDIATDSSTMPHVFATASLLHDLGVSARVDSDPLRSLIRHVGVYCRIENDIRSLEKERREGSLANAVFLMERFAPTARCLAFLQDELEGQARLVAATAERLEEGDPLRQLVCIMPDVHRALYDSPRGTYVFPEGSEATRGD